MRDRLARLAPHSVWVLISACVATFVLLRCIELHADPPMTVLGYDARELFAEPPAKSHEARNYAVFGAFKLSESDGYQFWRAQSPLWVYPLALFFRVFGCDYPQLRVFSTLYAALGLVLLLAFATRCMRPAALAFVGAAIALDAVHLHTARVGFIEPAVSSWLTLSMLALLLAEKRSLWLSVAHLAFAAAFFTKQGAMFALPVIAAATFVRLRALDRSRPEGRRAFWGVLGGMLLLLVAGALYVSLTDYARTAVHNYKHLALGYGAEPGQQVEGWSSVLRRLWDTDRYRHWIASVPISGAIALVSWIGLAVSACRHRRWPDYPVWLAMGWFAFALAGMGALANSALRFWTVLVFPAALLAGLGLDRAAAWLQLRGPRGSVALFAGVFGLLLLWNGRLHRQYLADPRYSVRDAAALVQVQIGDRPATVIGTVSPWVVLGTRYRNFYVRPKMNSEPGKMRALGVTHMLFRDLADAARDIVIRDFPGIQLQPKLRFSIRADPVALYELIEPQGAERRR